MYLSGKKETLYIEKLFWKQITIYSWEYIYDTQVAELIK